MPRPSARGHLALQAALALAGGLALAAGTRPPGPGARVVLELAAVLPLPEGQAGLVILREQGAETLLPLLVPDREAFAASSRRNGAGLVGRALEALGAEVREVELEAADDTTEGARVRLSQGARRLELPGRPSESVALALAAGVPIVVRRRLLDAEGLAPKDLEAARRELEGDGKSIEL